MSWIQQLIATYDENEGLAGKPGAHGASDCLPPIGHFVVNAQIELTIDKDGNFVDARAVPKEEEPTLIPCTPDSASRTAGLEPHPLHDNLAYIARDYTAYRKVKKDVPYDLYLAKLHDWAESSDSTEAVKAVYRYVSQHDAIHDLIGAKLLYEEAPGKIMEKWQDKSKPKPLLYQVAAGDLLKSMVRFRVIGTEEDPDLWKDIQLQKAWQNYYLHQHAANQQMCYATGMKEPATSKHNKGIRFSGDGAKLISSNDKDGFTFRGRFENAGECLSIGYDTSQKAMNALRWLIRLQGYNVGGRVFLAWGRKGVPLPSLATDTRRMLFGGAHRPTSKKIPNTMSTWAEALTKAMNGYRHEFKKQAGSQVNVMILDAATPGRLSICYYDELDGQVFINRVEQWHRYGMWKQTYYNEEENRAGSFYGVPTSKKLLQACYGQELSDTKLRQETERLFTAIEQGKDLPLEFSRIGLNRVIKQAAIQKNRLVWKKDLAEPVCSIIRYHYHHQGEEYEVALDEENKNRSYLYGRLLALADKLELATYSPEERKARQTNAMRYMEIFADRPATTWRTIQKKLLPYEHRQEAYGGKKRKLIHQVGSMFEEEDFLSDKPLDGRFLLGFYAQEHAIDEEIELRKKERERREMAEATGEENA